ncbi:MAG: FecR domain-containing protein [Lachnospiraceae bacterium]|nr:FecR domain-containing protein [Lachnospiraceae bacterium]
MTKKTGIMIGAVLAIVAVVAIGCVVLTGGKSDTYRSIMVYQINGNATITRENVGEMEAYENLMLQSGDAVAVASDSSLRLKLDNDKYLLAEQDTRMNIVADGDDENAKTYIDLQQGSVTSEIQNKLKSGASYEVNTPNSIMAVRGTIFRVEVEPKENGESDTKLTVFQGTVGVRQVLPDGTISNEEVKVEAGNELIIEGIQTAAETLGEPTEIDFDSLPSVITQYLGEVVQNGQKLADNVTAKIPGAQGEQELALQEAQKPESDQKAQVADAQPQDPEALDEQEPNEEDKAQEPEAPVKPKTKPADETTKNPQEKQDPEQPNQPETQLPQIEQPNQPETQPQTVQPQPTPQNPTPSGDEDSKKGSDDGSKKKTQYYTVTFQYNGSTFGTQKVKKGETATEPKLSPTQNGAWDYDFSQKVNKNVTVQWKEN